MDFRNYTVGRLVEGRGNYRENHEGYQEVLSWIRARVLDLGWEPQLYDGIESSIARSRGNRDGRADRVEVYGKKYGWIGFFEAAGRLSELNRLPERYEEGRLSDADIDPSFPDIPPALDLNVEGWLPVEPLDMKEWMQSADVRVPDSLLRRPSLLAEAGPWIALEGFLEKEDDSSTRRVFGFIRGMFVPKASVEKLLTWLAKRDYPGNYWIPDQPKSYYMFAGEFPWTAHLRAGRDFQGIRKLYQREIEQENGEAIVIELPAHDYSWEDYHSIVNQAGGHPVPSVALADYFDLRVLPNSLDWCDSNGQRASITLSKPDSFNYGDLLYVREDLLREYCTQFDLDFIWFVWGERDFALSQAWRRPEWVQEIFQTHAEIWRRIVRLDEIAPVDLGS